MLRRILHYQDGQVDFSFGLVEAAYGGLEKAAKTLLEQGADPNERDGYGWTALMYAAYGDHVETVRVLLDAGADVSAKRHGATALWWAREKGHPDIERLLVGTDRKFTESSMRRGSAREAEPRSLSPNTEMGLLGACF